MRLDARTTKSVVDLTSYFDDQGEMSNRDPHNLMATNDENFDYLFKIVLIGDCGTGKTCVVQRFRSGTFIERHGSTIGVDFSMKTVLIDDKKVKVRLFDQCLIG